jgi:2-iminobutanoate/2-iminopropanoate deaminase
MENGSKAVGPYSSGGIGGPLVYSSGQTSLDPEGNVIGIGDVATQTVETLKNLIAALAAGGASVEDIVKTTVFLPDLRHYPAMNEAYGKFFPKDPPARSTILAPLALPELLVEIEAIAVVED